VNTIGVEVPVRVVSVTAVAAGPVGEARRGTVTRQVVCVGQTTRAVDLPKVTVMRPSGLKRCAPISVIVCPATPLAGVRELITGWPGEALCGAGRRGGRARVGGGLGLGDVTAGVTDGVVALAALVAVVGRSSAGDPAAEE
jgi:hypothetical protein